MGFDIVYLPPIHPIGDQPQGPEQHPDRRARRSGSPWAIGVREGGHDAIHPELGTFEDFDAFVARAGELGLEVALDLALQCSPRITRGCSDHPEWFTTRGDGTIAYAENPPRNTRTFTRSTSTTTRRALRRILRIVLLWVEHGVKIFRVDNPHTKPGRVLGVADRRGQQTHPEVIFLAEAFTRPAMMHALGQGGFHQSYTYFTWRNTKEELRSTSGAQPRDRRTTSGRTSSPTPPTSSPNTCSSAARRPSRSARPSPRRQAHLGVYAGFELYEHVARPGAEEYIDNEKYEYKARDWTRRQNRGDPGPVPDPAQRDPARAPGAGDLQNLTVHQSSDSIHVVYSKHKTLPDGTKDTLIIVVNVDPHGTRESTASLDLPALELDPENFTQTAVHG